MGVVVDTNVFIDAENGRLQLEALKPLQGEPVFLAAITMAELLAGVHMAKTIDVRVRRRAFVENILGSAPVLDFDSEVARTYSELYAQALNNKSRQRLNVHDLQIAATAICHGHPVVTSNEDDFRWIPGVRLLKPR
ncbi:MAG TPA: type II toxin-antitoxin system VapC family toxin [Gammaproteobacteria bacterium]|nr:type II toxin-antitoxin system VapC family toxin [Gammaproteobacteria bacterium]